MSEEWDFTTFLDFLTASAALLQPARGAICIEWPAKEDKGELYNWVDTYKAISIADSVLGARAAPARDKFNDFIKAASVPVEDGEAIDRVRREHQRPGEGSFVPDRFFRLHRISFLMMLCKELCRINAVITKVIFTDAHVQNVHPIRKLFNYQSTIHPPASLIVPLALIQPF